MCKGFDSHKAKKCNINHMTEPTHIPRFAYPPHKMFLFSDYTDQSMIVKQNIK